MKGSKIALVRSYLGVPRAAGQVNILIFLVKIIFPYACQYFWDRGKCLFYDITKPAMPVKKVVLHDSGYICKM